VASTITNGSGGYSFTNADIPVTGSFSIIINPPAGKIFVTHPAILWSTSVVLPSTEDEPPTGAVFFDYHLNTITNRLSAVNRMLFAGGNLDFGLGNALAPSIFACVGLPANLITEADGGHFGNSSYIWETTHPHQKGYSYNGNLYTSIPATCTDYAFSNTSATSGAFRGVLIGEGNYTVTSFPGTLSDIAYAPYMSQMLNNVSGGWRKSYGTTVADVNDRFLAVNGATAGSLPFFKQTILTLTAGGVYTLAFYGKHANSYAQGTVTDAQIVIELLDNGNAIVTSGSLNLSPTGSFLDNRPEAPWQLRIFSFTAPGGSGPFTVQLRASTTAAMGNDFYIDDIVLYPCSMGILPLQLMNFTARQDINENINLGWELKNPLSAVVETEYSKDGKNFFKLGLVSVLPAVTNYGFTHLKPGSGIHYYRLKISDAQGKPIYSEIKKIDTRNIQSRITVYPNPVTDKLNIQCSEIVYAFEIIDEWGKLILKISHGSSNAVQINTRKFPAGMYYIKVIGKEKVSLHKISGNSISF